MATISCRVPFPNTGSRSPDITTYDNDGYPETIIEVKPHLSPLSRSHSNLRFKSLNLGIDEDDRNCSGSYETVGSSVSWRDRSLSRFGSMASLSTTSNADSSRSGNCRSRIHCLDTDILPRLSFDSEYDQHMVDRGNKILHLITAIQRPIFFRTHHSLSRCISLQGNGICYLPDVTIRHTETGIVKQARRLKKRFGVYQIDLNYSPVVIEMMLKSSVSEALQFEDKDYQLSLRIQSDLNNLRNNIYVVKLLHLMETDTCLIAITESVSGNMSEYGDWIRDSKLVQFAFKQVIEGYIRLIEIGYYHCNLCLENFLVQMKLNPENPKIPKIIVKISGFEQAIRIDSIPPTMDSDKTSGNPSYLAPETFDGSFDVEKSDVWSLGIVLYTLLTGEPPFDIANSSDSTFNRFVENGFCVIGHLLDDMHADVNAINLLKCILVIDPHKRMDAEAISKHPFLL